MTKCDDCNEVLDGDIYGDDDAPIEHQGDFCKEYWYNNHKHEYDPWE